MKKAKLISHLAELDNIRRDEYMPSEVHDIIIQAEKVIARLLSEELENPTSDEKPSSIAKILGK